MLSKKSLYEWVRIRDFTASWVRNKMCGLISGVSEFRILCNSISTVGFFVEALQLEIFWVRGEGGRVDLSFKVQKLFVGKLSVKFYF